MACLSIFLAFLLTLSTLNAINAVEYTVTNRAPTTPGGIRFSNELGDDYTIKTMDQATNFFWTLFQQYTEADRKDVARVSFFLDDMEGIAYASNNEIHVGDDYIQGITDGAHLAVGRVGGNESSVGLIEGIADFMRLKADYAPPNWEKPGQGERWDQGYAVTARFLDYCNDLRDGFVVELNKKMRVTYIDNFFVELLGKPVDQLWMDYKAKFGN
ncbi:plant basic secretory family protein [Salix suchowensis]|nr:plant basic secretory family protein [Salix suchowensis]